MSRFQTEDIRFNVTPARYLPEMEWGRMQYLGLNALTVALNGRRESAEIQHVLSFDKPELYRDGHINPQIDVDRGRLNPGLFARSMVMTAHKDDKLVASGVSYANTSGNLRAAKMLTPARLPLPKVGGKRYHWIREMFVHPDFQHRGIARVGLYLLLGQRSPHQIATAYTWSERYDVALGLESLGIESTGETELQEVFGPDTRPTRTMRLAGQSGVVMRKIIELPGARRSIQAASIK